jgi:hypothetical protein
MTRMFALTRWPDRFYSATELSIYFDHVRNKEGATLELEGARFINSHIALWARPGSAIGATICPGSVTGTSNSGCAICLTAEPPTGARCVVGIPLTHITGTG